MAIYKVVFEKLYTIFTLLKMGLFGAALELWANKAPFLKSVLHIPQ